MTLKGQGHRQNKWHHRIPWPNKHRSRHQNNHPKCFGSKAMVKDVFLHNGGNVTRSCTSHFQTAQEVFWFVERPRPSYPVLKFGDNLSSRNRDMAQNVILHSCDLERSRSSMRSTIFCTAICTLPMSIHVKFCQNLIDSCSVMVA